MLCCTYVTPPADSEHQKRNNKNKEYKQNKEN